MEGSRIKGHQNERKRREIKERILGFCASFNMGCGLFCVYLHQLTSSWSLKVTQQMYIQIRESRATRATTENQQHAHWNHKSRLGIINCQLNSNQELMMVFM